VVGQVIVHVHTIDAWDEQVVVWAAAHRTPLLNDITKYTTFLANTEPVVGIGIVVAVILVVRHHGREAMFLVSCVVLEVTVFIGVNFVVDRPRPQVTHLNSLPRTSSFPSGHVAASVALWLAIALIVTILVSNRAVRVVAWVPFAVIPAVV